MRVNFFKSSFGPSRDDVWTALRAQIGGDVVPRTIWSTLSGSTLLGMQDIQIGHPAFDEAFVIKSNDESGTGSAKWNGSKGCTTCLPKPSTSCRKWVSPEAEPAAVTI